ncbi:unnamed protein product [Effrenium voratum]|nr:unnamed protein product [Effrenium voratum]
MQREDAGPTLLEAKKGKVRKGGYNVCEMMLATDLKSLRSKGYPVELVATGRGFAGLGGFHTSILICGEEYYFCPMGIRFSPKLVSHPRPHEALRLRVGVSQATGTELLNFLADHFQSGSYDFLRKNCNSFTDCALYYLCGKRLDFRYRAMEKLGWIAESQTGFLGTISEGEYTANPAAEDFDLEELLEQIEDARGESEEELELELPHAPSVPMVGCWPGIPGL